MTQACLLNANTEDSKIDLCQDLSARYIRPYSNNYLWLKHRFLFLTVLLLAVLLNSNAQSFNYTAGWLQIDSCEAKGLPKTALQTANRLYNQARAEKNYSQFVKAFIYTMKYRSMTSDDAFVTNLVEAERVADSASFPAKPILHSMLGEMYWWYFENNRYKFYNRSQTAQFVPADIATWDLTRLVAKVVDHYQHSMDEPGRLKLVNLTDFKSIVAYDSSFNTMLRPTLYDFVTLRAIELFSKEETNLTRPGSEFSMNNDDFFLPADTFVRIGIATTDSLSYKFRAIKLFQDLLRIHLNDNTPEAWMLVDLKRLDFVNRNYNGDAKDSLYLKALYFLEKKCANVTYHGGVGMLIAEKLSALGESYNPRVSEAYKWDKKLAKDKALSLIKNNPGEKKSIEQFISNIERKEIGLTIEKENIPNEPFRALVAYKNTDSIYIRAIKTTYQEYTDFVKEYNERDRTKYIEFDKYVVDYFSKKPAVVRYTVALPNDGDYQRHYAEVKIPALDNGLYVIIAGTSPDMDYNKNMVSHGLTAITNISFINRSNKEGDNEFYMLNRKTGEPLEGVKVDCWSTYDYSVPPMLSVSYTSDKEGRFLVDNKIQTYYLNFTWQGDMWTNHGIELLFPNYNFTNYANTSYTDKLKSFFFTDRAIYRHGQTIYFKGILLETVGNKSNEIRPNEPTKVRLTDVNNQNVADLKLTTNEYGSFSGSFIVPNKGLNGRMTIRNEYGNISITVEDYKRPKFEVKFDTLRSSYKLGETVTVSGSAVMYSGANVDGAEVKYHVVRQTRYNGWYCWWRPRPSVPDKEIASGTVKTRADGTFDISFRALADASVAASTNPTFTYTVSVDITDINGETHSATKNINAGYKALVVNVAMPEKIDKTGKHEYKLSTQNLNGDFEAAAGSIAVYRLKTPDKTFRERKWEQPDKFTMPKDEYYRTFPSDLYKDELIPSGWEVEKTVLQTTFNTATERTLKLADQSKWKDGVYKLAIRSTDKFGTPVEETIYFTLYDRKSSKLPFATADWFDAVKGIGEPGDTAQLVMGSGYDNTRILMEVEADNKIVRKEWVTLKNQQRLMTYPLTEKDRGNFGVHYTFVRNNRLYVHNATIIVSFTNKKLDISFETFRNKLQPGEKDQWRLRVKGKTGDKAAAEMVATLYDASLDAFKPNSFNFNLWNSYYPRLGWHASNGFDVLGFNTYTKNQEFETNYVASYLNELYRFKWFGFGYGTSNRPMRSLRFKSAVGSVTGSVPLNEVAASSVDDAIQGRLAGVDIVAASGAPGLKASKIGPIEMLKAKDEETKKAEPDLSSVKLRTNLNETAFFFPSLQTDSTGDVLINFTIPEALTRWKMLGFAHTKELAYGFTQNELVTQKDLMVTPNAPRFFREGDSIRFTAKVTSLSDKELQGTAQLMLFDALTMKPVDAALSNHKPQQSFTVKKGESVNMQWSLAIPIGLQAVTYRVVAKAGDYSDGEESSLPVLTNSTLVTETLPLPVKGRGTKTFTLDKLLHNTSTTLRNHQLTLEYTSNPAWYAVQALPYLMEYPYECAEQTFSRFYANSIASHIANSNPRIRQVFDAWKNYSPEALLSNLEKNQELKGLLLEETPWVLNSQNESERKKRVALLFDLNRMSDELGKALDKLAKMQTPGGSWPWFAGGPDDRYITQHIVCGMGKLDHLGVKSIRNDSKTWEMVRKGITYTDDRIKDDYVALKRLADAGMTKLSDNHIGYTQIQYLYARSFFNDIAIKAGTREAFDYYLSQARTYWLSNSFYMQGMIALALNRYKEQKIPMGIVKSMREHAITSAEMGMYFKYESGWCWYQAPIETQALMIETFDEVAHDTTSVNEMKVWLLKQKQTQDWKTTKATVEACYALLLRGDNWFTTDPSVDIQVGSQSLNPATMPELKAEAGTGYFKTSWNGADIKPDMGRVTITKTNNAVSWGALYWQYFEQLDKITASETPLKLKKQLFLEANTASGSVIRPISDTTHLYPGSLIKVRIELRVDRDMEYVHMKDMRAAGLEPVNVLSLFKYQDGFEYYESIRDAATNFFFGWLPKGTYVFEYPLRVTHYGNFSNGITTIQSMYAPEFTSHSEGVRLVVK